MGWMNTPPELYWKLRILQAWESLQIKWYKLWRKS